MAMQTNITYITGYLDAPPAVAGAVKEVVALAKFDLRDGKYKDQLAALERELDDIYTEYMMEQHEKEQAVFDWDEHVEFAYDDDDTVWDDRITDRAKKTMKSRQDILTPVAAAKAQKSSKTHKLAPREEKRDRTKKAAARGESVARNNSKAKKMAMCM
jgi:hypothetical protein